MRQAKVETATRHVKVPGGSLELVKKIAEEQRRSEHSVLVWAIELGLKKIALEMGRPQGGGRGGRVK